MEGPQENGTYTEFDWSPVFLSSLFPRPLSGPKRETGLPRKGLLRGPEEGQGFLCVGTDMLLFPRPSVLWTRGET